MLKLVTVRTGQLLLEHIVIILDQIPVMSIATLLMSFMQVQPSSFFILFIEKFESQIRDFPSSVTVSEKKLLFYNNDSGIF